MTVRELVTKLTNNGAAPAGGVPTTIIEPQPGRRLINVRELWEYRDLFFFLVWRDIKVRYAQSILGVGRAVIQPVFSMIVFTIVFGNRSAERSRRSLAKVSSDGVPYAIFSYAALVPWTYFASALTDASGSLISASGMITKVYFPRLIIPLASVLGKLVDFGVAMLILFGLMIYFGSTPTVWAVLLPLLVLLMPVPSLGSGQALSRGEGMLTAAGMGMWLTALAIQYRDIKYAMGFAVQLLMYATPVVYPASLIPERFRLLYGLNPMAGPSTGSGQA